MRSISARFLRTTLASTALLAIAAAAHAQISSAAGWVELSETWSGGPNVWVGAYNGSLTWNYAGDPSLAFAGDYNLTDSATYLYSSGYSGLTGPTTDYSGAENGMYWYFGNSGNDYEQITWTFNYASYSEIDVNGGWGYDEDFANVKEYNSDYEILFDITGVAWTGYQTQEYTDSVTYTEALAPGQVDLIQSYTLHRSDLNDTPSSPGPVAAMPFALSAVLARHRRRRRGA